MSETDMDAPIRATILATIHNLEERRLEIDWQITASIKAARDRGATWRDVGQALGTSTQAAWSKHHPRDLGKILPGQGANHVEQDD